MSRIICGDSLKALQELPDNSVNCCITSPPYYALRNYNIDGQIGLEDSPTDYVNTLTTIFNEVRRVLTTDGTLWLNIGDSYANQKSGDTYSGFNERYSGTGINGKQSKTLANFDRTKKFNFGVKPKDLNGIPWMVAFALRAAGYYLRQDIIWHKPNPMPESTRDRCTKAHEYVFLMSKSEKYYYDQEAIKIPASTNTLDRNKYKFKGAFKGQFNGAPNEKRWQEGRPIEKPEFGKNGMANRRSVWTVAPKPFRGAHFATFPPDLIRPMILAGCPPGGVVLDPFFGAGTVGVVCKELSREYIGIDLSMEYCIMATERIGNQDVIHIL